MATAVMVERFLSKDGHVYDHLAKAELADRVWEEENEYDLEKEIPQFEQEGRNKIRWARYPCVVIAQTRDDRYIFLASSYEEICDACLHIVGQFEPYYFNTVRERAISQSIVATGNGAAALGFLLNYHHIETTVENFSKYEKSK